MINVDFHLHSKYSSATSRSMGFREMGDGARKKGIDLLGTGDCLQKKWLEEIKGMDENMGIYHQGGMNFVLTTEVEDSRRVHHLLLFPSIEAVEQFRGEMGSFSVNMDLEGRPRLGCGGERIAEAAERCCALIGPAHAFTPWTAIYAYFDSLKDCYGGMMDYISFLELGLSADSDYADRISELSGLTFLTNSDAHSPTPQRIAREFNRIEVNNLSFTSVSDAILRRNGNSFVLNVGLPPEEGKYNESACIKCLKHYPLEACCERKWRCDCGGIIKRGVLDRVSELSDYGEPHHPGYRPPYLHLIPLMEIILKVVNDRKSAFSEWGRLVERFGSEIGVLVDADMRTIRETTADRVADAVLSFREGRIVVHPGGGGVYGNVEIPGRKQRNLLEY